MRQGLKRGILEVFAANMVVVILGLVTGFVLPCILSENEYADIRTFQLYITYIGLLHFGYVDGMYLRYGGQELSGSMDERFASGLVTMRVFQTAVCVIATVLCAFSGSYLWVAFALSALPVNMRTYYSFLYQATGWFSAYSRILRLQSYGMFAANLILLFVFRARDGRTYVAAYLAVHVLIWLSLEWYFSRRFRLPAGRHFRLSEIPAHIRPGFPLMLGGLAAILMVNMDQWFVKWFMPSAVFAQYAFAVSINGFMFNAITPVTTTLYNYFCREEDPEKRMRIFRDVTVFATLLPAAAFPVCLLLALFLPNYGSARPVIILLFASEIFYTVINAVYVNLYKATGRTKRYFIKMAMILIAAAVLNYIGALYVGVKEYHTAVTLLMYMIWLILCVADFPALRPTPSMCLYLFAETVLFVCCSAALPPVTGLLVYIGVTGILVFFLMRPVLGEAKTAWETLRARLQRE